MIRLGERTLEDNKLVDQCARAHGRWGLHGFSVFEVPNGDYQLLARLVPIVTVRPKSLRGRRRRATRELGSHSCRPVIIRTGPSSCPSPRRLSSARVRMPLRRTAGQPGLGRKDGDVTMVTIVSYRLLRPERSIPTTSVPTSWWSAGSRRDPRANDPRPSILSPATQSDCRRRRGATVARPSHAPRREPRVGSGPASQRLQRGRLIGCAARAATARTVELRATRVPHRRQLFASRGGMSRHEPTL